MSLLLTFVGSNDCKVVASVSTGILTEASDFLIAENNDFLIQE